MTITKAKLYKTAIVSINNSRIPKGTYVSVKYLRGTELKCFECSADGITEVLYECHLHSFVL